MNLHKQAALSDEIEYPSSDGEPMAETDIHRDLMIELISSLEKFFQTDSQVYVSGNLFLYYEKGRPDRVVAPDVFVVRGVPKGQRRIYKLWQEGQAPEVVFEISSRKTWGDDLHRKFQLYARLGVKEYFIFDPEYDYLPEPLLAFRLEDDLYEKVEVRDGRVLSQALGLEVVNTGQTLRLFDPASGQFLPTRQEESEALRQAEAALRQAEARAQAEAEARQRAEAELAQLREEMARLRSQN